MKSSRKKNQHFHLLGIGGTFMGGLALLLQELGYQVTGSDGPLYPPMSTQLEIKGVPVCKGYGLDSLKLKPDYFVVGNVMKRGMPIIEAILNRNLPMLSGPECLRQYILQYKTVLGIAGTHGKTTTSSLLAWILDSAGYHPGFLIGGVAPQLKTSSRLGENAPDGQAYFVLECDEYDTVFFDKRSKFVHYRPKVTVLNNLEYDHADIFPNLEAIENQFHQLVRTLPSEGTLIYPQEDVAIARVLAKGCWTQEQTLGELTKPIGEKKVVSDWAFQSHPEKSKNQTRFTIFQNDQHLGTITWPLLGLHNQYNALAAVAAAAAIGIAPTKACEALSQFQGVKRRLELRKETPHYCLYDDFAHHPTAIAKTLAGLREQVGSEPIWVVVDIRSNTMKQGVHQETLVLALKEANQIFFYQDKTFISWDVQRIHQLTSKPGGVYHNVEDLVEALKNGLQGAKSEVNARVHLLGMSNGAFERVYQYL